MNCLDCLSQQGHGCEINMNPTSIMYLNATKLASSCQGSVRNPSVICVYLNCFAHKVTFEFSTVHRKHCTM